MSMFANEVEAAGVYNVRTAVGFLVRDGKLPEDIQPALRVLAERVLKVAKERGVTPDIVFEELVTAEELKEAFAMGGTDHPDPTLHSSPVVSGKMIGIEAKFEDLAREYSNRGKCLEAARKFAGSVRGKVEKVLIVNSWASREDKFEVESWPFHAVVVGHDGRGWFAGAPGSGDLHFASDLGELLPLLALEFGGLWLREAEIEKAMAKGVKELAIYSEDWVC